MKRFQFSAPTKVIGGAGVVAEVGEVVRSLEGHRALVVTDTGVVGAGLVAPVLDALKSAGVLATVFDEVKPDPTVEVVSRGAELVRQGGCDLLVAVGGGSSIDAAKGISVVAANGGSIGDYEGVNKYTKRPVPIIAIPTTAGTGSEVTFGAVLTDEARNYKFIVYGDTLVPRAALLDPKMVVGAPASVKVPTGMDALTHAIESYTSLGASPQTEALALYAIRLVSADLRRFVSSTEDLEAAWHMLVAANVAGIGFALSRLGIVHAAALPLGAFFHVPHGVACTVLLPHGMRFNQGAAAFKYRDIARAMGEDVDGLSVADAALVAVQAVERLSRDIGAPSRLRDLGVKSDKVPQMALDAMKSGHIPANPRPITVEDIESLYRDAM